LFCQRQLLLLLLLLLLLAKRWHRAGSFWTLIFTMINKVGNGNM